MLWLVFFMVFATALAVLVVVYVAYPHRGETVPRVAWLGQWMRAKVDGLPTIGNSQSSLPAAAPTSESPLSEPARP